MGKSKKLKEKIDSRSVIDAITNQTYIGICIYQEANKIGQLKYINRELAELFEYSYDNVINHLDDEYLINEIIPEHDYLEFNHLLHGHIKKDGKVAIFDFFSQPIRYKEGDAELVILRDITEQRKKLQILKDRYRELSHDIKHPIGAMVPVFNLLIKMCKEKGYNDIIQALENAKNTFTHLKKRSEELFDNIEKEIQKSELMKEKINLTQLIQESIDLVMERAKERKITIEFNSPEDIWIYADKFRINNVIDNLISNAINYTPKDKKGIIQVNIVKKEKTILISVKDEGIGIPKEEIKKLFTHKAIVKNDDANIITGSGKGLIFTQQNIKLHGGEIWAESEGKNNGTTFFVKLDTTY